MDILFTLPSIYVLEENIECQAFLRLKFMKKYLNIKVRDSSTNLPSGDNLFYECKICHAEVFSSPKHSAACDCGNVIVDSDAGRQAFNEITKVAIFEKVDRTLRVKK
jgi:ribosomal protein S27E